MSCKIWHFDTLGNKEGYVPDLISKKNNIDTADPIISFSYMVSAH
jgi:hypothetical protein